MIRRELDLHAIAYNTIRRLKPYQLLTAPRAQFSVSPSRRKQGHVAQEFIPAKPDKLASLQQAVRLCDV